MNGRYSKDKELAPRINTLKFKENSKDEETAPEKEEMFFFKKEKGS